MAKVSWLEYTGQTTSELLACKNTHRIASLLCAFEWGIQAKVGPGGEEELTKDERLVLAVMALQREVNNGGYSQFFTNSSRRFVSIIVESLQCIGCGTTAAISLALTGRYYGDGKTATRYHLVIVCGIGVGLGRGGAEYFGKRRT